MGAYAIIASPDGTYVYYVHADTVAAVRQFLATREHCYELILNGIGSEQDAHDKCLAYVEQRANGRPFCELGTFEGT